MKTIEILSLGLMVMWLVSCGKENKGVTLASEAFSTSQAIARMAVTPLVAEFKVCVARVKLVDKDGKEQGGDENGEIKFAPGLIDLSDGAAKDWGNITIPVGFKLSKIKVKVKKDKDLCGVDYSVLFNGQGSPQDIEFKWKFDPAISLDSSTQILSLNFAAVVAALRTAAEQGDLARIKDHIEGVEGDATKK